jgi:hypothetical protein
MEAAKAQNWAVEPQGKNGICFLIEPFWAAADMPQQQIITTLIKIKVTFHTRLLHFQRIITIA